MTSGQRDGLDDTVRGVLSDSRLVVGIVGIILFVAVLSGFVNFTTEERELGEGTASITVVEPSGDTLVVTDGRFGTGAQYLRVPNLIVRITEIEGRPRIVYRITVPALDIDKQETKILSDSGQIRVEMDDVALKETEPGTYDGRISVRIQSFTDDTTAVNRSVEVLAS